MGLQGPLGKDKSQRMRRRNTMAVVTPTDKSSYDYNFQDKVTRWFKALVTGNADHIKGMLRAENNNFIIFKNPVAKCCLHIAAETNQLDIILPIIQTMKKMTSPFCVNPFTFIDVTGKTPMYYAIKNKNLDMVRLFVAANAPFSEAVDINGNTPIHVAGIYGFRDCIIYLKHIDAAYTTNILGQSPIDLTSSLTCKDLLKDLYSEDRPDFTQDIFTKMQSYSHTSLAQAVSISLTNFKILPPLSNRRTSASPRR
jgi:hypothetical protein